MRRIGLVAQREFRQIARTRSFWITLLLVPLMFVIMPLFGRLMEPPETNRFFLLDASNRYGPAVLERIETGARGDELFQFARYARQWDLKAKDPAAVWDDGERPFSDQEVRAFVQAGGSKAALAQAGPLPKDAPAFKVPARDWMRADLPQDVPTNQGADAFGKAASRYLVGGTGRPKGYEPVAAAVYIPQQVTPATPVRVWTSGGGGFELIDRVRREMNDDMRGDIAATAGLDAATAKAIQAASAPIAVTRPPRGEGRERMTIQSALPLGIAYFLLVSVFTSGAWLLQGVLEERSNKLLEAVLACVTPGELMYGKLLGIVGIGFSVMIVWGGCIAAFGYFMPGPASEFIKPAIGSLNTPWLAIALVFYFVTGYLICATIFLAIGAISESMQDAQAYLSPVSLMLFMPFFLLGSLINNPDALVAKVLSWIPVYTPFAMMARMGAGVEPYEVIGTSILLVVFVALELWLLGRVFRSNLLRTGQPPRIAELFRLMSKPASK